MICILDLASERDDQLIERSASEISMQLWIGEIALLSLLLSALLEDQM